MSRAGAGTVLALVVAGAAGVAHLAVDSLAHLSSAATPMERAWLALSALAALACVAWLLVVLALALAEGWGVTPGRATGPAWLRPRAARVLVGAVLGTTVASLPGVAAGTPLPDPAPSSWARLDGLPPLLTPAGPDVHRASVRRPVERVVVGRGDCLWQVTERLLHAAGASPSDAVVSERWPLLYRANRDRVGADPDLLLPGTVLRVPAALSPALSRTAVDD